jgi:hypothetical protein
VNGFGVLVILVRELFLLSTPVPRSEEHMVQALPFTDERLDKFRVDEVITSLMSFAERFVSGFSCALML